ncbi:MAG: ATP-grasp domain-containing protein [Alphaproteobacteria bacterium]
MTYRVLLTSVGGGLGPVNVKSFQACTRRKVSVLGVDTRADAAGRYFADAFATVPPGDDPAYLDAILTLLEKQPVDLILPCSDEEASALAKGRAEIEKTGATLAAVDSALLETMRDKAASYRLLDAHGIATPQGEVAETVSALDRAIERMLDLHGEIAAKPMISRGSRDTFIVCRDIVGIDDPNDGREIYCDLASFRERFILRLRTLLPVVVMERLLPPAYDIDVLTWQGQLLRAAPRRRINTGGVPFRGGVIEMRPDLLDVAERVTRAANMSWLYDYDIMMRRSGEPVVMELNPRPSGSIAAAIAAGIPFYDDLISLALGETLPDIAMPSGVTVMPYTDVAVLR